MRAAGKLLIISFSAIPAQDAHTARVTVGVRGLRRLFSAIDVVTLKGTFLSHIERYHGSRLLRVPLLGETAADKAESFRRAVRRQIESEGYDVVHVRGPIEGAPIAEAREEKEYRVVYEAGTFTTSDASFYLGGPEEVAELERRLSDDELRCVSEADLVLVHGESAVAALRAKGIASRTAIVRPGVNVDFFDWEAPWETDEPVILCLGSLASWRDVPGVIEALRILRKDHPARLHWVGEVDDSKRELVTHYAKERGLGDALSVAPAAEPEELPRLISSATVCLAPAGSAERYSVWGECPEGLLEFLACKRPVVAARTPGTAEIVRPGVEAAFYEPGDAESLAESLAGLLSSQSDRSRLAEAGYRRVRESFSASEERRRLLGEYRTLLGVDPRTPPASDQGEDAEDAAPADVAEPLPVDVDTAVIRDDAETSKIQLDGDTKRLELPEEARDTDPSIELDDASGEGLPDESWPEAETGLRAPRDDTGKIVTQKIDASAVLGEDTSRVAASPTSATDAED